jgi:hypothetical protein
MYRNEVETIYAIKAKNTYRNEVETIYASTLPSCHACSIQFEPSKRASLRICFRRKHQAALAFPKAPLFDNTYRNELTD